MEEPQTQSIAITEELAHNINALVELLTEFTQTTGQESRNPLALLESFSCPEFTITATPFAVASGSLEIVVSISLTQGDTPFGIFSITETDLMFSGMGFVMSTIDLKCIRPSLPIPPHAARISVRLIEAFPWRANDLEWKITQYKEFLERWCQVEFIAKEEGQTPDLFEISSDPEVQQALIHQHLPPKH